MLETVALPLFAARRAGVRRALEEPTPRGRRSRSARSCWRRRRASRGSCCCRSWRPRCSCSRHARRAQPPAVAAVARRRARCSPPRGRGPAGAGRCGDPDARRLRGPPAASYEAGEVLRWAAANAGAFVVATGVAPAIAFVLLALRRAVEAHLSRRYVAVTAASVAWLVGLAALAAAWEPVGLKERYAFYAEPLAPGRAAGLARARALRPRLTAAAVAVDGRRARGDVAARADPRRAVVPRQRLRAVRARTSSAAPRPPCWPPHSWRPRSAPRSCSRRRPGSESAHRLRSARSWCWARCSRATASSTAPAAPTSSRASSGGSSSTTPSAPTRASSI